MLSSKPHCVRLKAIKALKQHFRKEEGKSLAGMIDKSAWMQNLCIFTMYMYIYELIFVPRNIGGQPVKMSKLSLNSLPNYDDFWRCWGKSFFFLKTMWGKKQKMQVTFIFFLAHLSTTCSGGTIVTGHRLSSVRPSVCPSVRLSVRPSICPSVNNFFKNLLLQNQKANLDKTWQECSLGEALQKLLKEFNSNKNSGCHGNKMAENGKNL